MDMGQHMQHIQGKQHNAVAQQCSIAAKSKQNLEIQIEDLSLKGRMNQRVHNKLNHVEQVSQSVRQRDGSQKAGKQQRPQKVNKANSEKW